MPRLWRRWPIIACGLRPTSCGMLWGPARGWIPPTVDCWAWLWRNCNCWKSRRDQIEQEMAERLRPHQDSVLRLAEVPGLGADSAPPIVAEVGARAAAFPSAGDLASWVGACPGDEESAGKSYSHRSPKGNRQMRRLLNQAANAAVKLKGSIFALLYRRYVTRLGHNVTIGIIAHRLCRLIWKILHQGVRYEERGPTV